MTPEILLLHRKGPERFRLENMGSHAFSFQTCLRHIVLVDSQELNAGWVDEIREGDERLHGEDAYKLLLEIICGLHSPLLGETEVYGQFKNAVGQFNTPATPWGSLLARTFRLLFEDAKRIRQSYLEDLGSQSYGSILRRELRSLKRVHILGAGHLVKEILPWIAKEGIEIHVHCRDPKRGQVETAADEKVHFHSIGDSIGDTNNDRVQLAEAQVLIVAAPVSSAWMNEWMPASNDLRLVADLRADSAVDRFQAADSETRILDLGEFMSRLTTNQALLAERKELSLTAIEAAASERARAIEYRPFGWEDVCA